MASWANYVEGEADAKVVAINGEAEAVVIPLVGPRPARLERVLTRSLGPSSIPSLGDGVMLGTAWIDRPVDTQGLHSLLPRPP